MNIRFSLLSICAIFSFNMAIGSECFDTHGWCKIPKISLGNQSESDLASGFLKFYKAILAANADELQKIQVAGGAQAMDLEGNLGKALFAARFFIRNSPVSIDGVVDDKMFELFINLAFSASNMHTPSYRCFLLDIDFLQKLPPAQKFVYDLMAHLCLVNSMRIEACKVSTDGKVSQDDKKMWAFPTQDSGWAYDTEPNVLYAWDIFIQRSFDKVCGLFGEEAQFILPDRAKVIPCDS
jgi:hypothetical protein